jgi:hypothetical protein
LPVGTRCYSHDPYTCQYGPLASSFELGNEHLGIIGGDEFLDQMSVICRIQCHMMLLEGGAMGLVKQYGSAVWHSVDWLYTAWDKQQLPDVSAVVTRLLGVHNFRYRSWSSFMTVHGLEGRDEESHVVQRQLHNLRVRVHPFHGCSAVAETEYMLW